MQSIFILHLYEIVNSIIQKTFCFMDLKRIFSLLCLICCFAKANAQVPELKVKGNTDAANPVQLKGLSIDVKVAGNIATTTMTMTFCNNSQRTLEGELTFPMPEGVSINRYALDINGRLREAVPVEKAKATEVFESIEHRNIDPGILEQVEGNNFRTRVYPLNPGVNRIVLVGYSQRMNMATGKGLRYYLPLDYVAAIPDFSLNVTVADVVNKPQLQQQPDGSFQFVAKGNSWNAVFNQKNYLPKKSLEIFIPKNSDIPDVVMQKASGGNYYFMANVNTAVASRSRNWPNTLGIIWDVSLSGRQRNIDKELALLDKIIQQKKNINIEIALLNNTFKKGKSFAVKNGDISALKQYLQSLVYDGGTDFSAMKDGVIRAEEYLLFSDGLSTFGSSTARFNAPVHSITTAAKADYSTLKNIALASGGQFINLNEKNTDEAYKTIASQPLQFLGVKNSTALSEVYPAANTTCGNNLLVTGISNAGNTTATLLFGYGKQVLKEVTVKLDANKYAVNTIDVDKIWAQEKIAALDIDYEKNKQEIALLGSQFGIVTRNTSLIVLENVEDYIRYNIAPPAELQQEYDRMKKAGVVQQEQRINDMLQQAISMTATLREWWEKKFVTLPPKRYPKAENRRMSAVEEVPAPPANGDDVIDAVMVVGAPAAAAPAPPPPPPSVSVNAAPPRAVMKDEAVPVESNFFNSAEKKEAEAVYEEVTITRTMSASASQVVTSEAIENRPVADRILGYEGGAKGSIEIPDFKSDQDYIARLKDVPLKDAYKLYLSLREEYISTPVFYFNMASWFYAQKDSSTALMILSNIAELQLENAELYKMMAYKLKQIGNFDKEVYITRKVLEWRPMDAQSVRDYGLALADGGQYQQALDTLYSILLKTYSPEAANRDDGIEEVVIAEINNLISLHGRKLNTSRIDKKLIAALPVDIRVVLNWNKNDTDIDLWVTGPDGEKCYYGNNETQSGGRISNDFTAGYGPEQFLLRKATKGAYTIQTNYFGDSQLSLSGPTTLMAEVYLYYSSGKQERKVIVLQASDEDRDGSGVLVGNFNFR